jgi:NTP pyrophosphatase (non-canonical NTP hydrolase)
MTDYMDAMQPCPVCGKERWAGHLHVCEKAPTDIFALHERLTAHLFPPYSNTDERFLALALCGEVGELANMIKKRWRDGVDLTDEIKDELADIRAYHALLCHIFDLDGAKLDDRIEQKLLKVVEKHKARLAK